MPRSTLLIALAATLAAGCNKDNADTKAPGVIGGVGDDIGAEVDGASNSAEGVGEDVTEEVGNAGDTVEGVGEDVSETAGDVVD